MNEILRAIQGESWTSIYIQRQKEAALRGIVVLSLATVGLAALFSKSASA
jgi:hypothetical protein